MTRYDPNTVPIMQNWSKWPFHSEESRGGENQSGPSFSFFCFSFFPPFCLTIPCMLKLQRLCTCLHNICSRQKKGKPAARQFKLTSAHEAIFLHSPTRRNSFVRSHVVFLFWCVCLFGFFVRHLCPRPLTASPRRLQDTPAMLKPARGDRWRKRGQTFLPVSGGAGAGSHHKG